MSVSTINIAIRSGTASLEQDFAKANKLGANAAQGIKQEFDRVDFAESRAGALLLNEQLGTRLPRHLTSLIATLPGVGAAFAAALPIIAVVVFVTKLAELAEHFKKVREEAEKAALEQVALGTTVNKALSSLDEKLLQVGIKTDELNNNHLAALRKQLELIDKQSMSQLASSFDTVAKAAENLFKDLTVKWYQFGIGSEGAKHALEQFQGQYESLLAQGKGDKAADLLHGTLDSAQKVLEFQKQYIANQVNSSTDHGGIAEHIEKANKFEEASLALKKAGVGVTDQEVKSQQALVDTLIAQGEVERKVAAIGKGEKSNERAKYVVDNIALIEKEFAAQKAATAAETKEAVAGYQLQYEEGKISLAQLGDLKQAAMDAEYVATAAHLARLEGLNAHRPEALKQVLAQERALEASHNADVLDSVGKAVKTNREGLLELDKLNTAFNAKEEADQEKANAATLASIEKNNKARIADFGMIQGEGNKKLAAIDAEIRNLERLREQYNLTGKARQDVDNAIHRLAMQRQADQIQELLGSTKLGDNFHAVMLKMAVDGQNWHTKMATGFEQSIGQMNSSLAQFITTGKGSFASLAQSALSNFIEMALQYGESKLEMALIDKLFGAKKGIQNIGMAQSNTAVAATEALASVPWPANIAAATETEALGQAFSAQAGAVAFFERGGEVPEGAATGVPAILHPKEMVLDRALADVVRGAAANNSKGDNTNGNARHATYAPTINAPMASASEIDAKLKGHFDRWARSEARKRYERFD